jgi:drug/metabolite transporter (DMT)-like permease
MSQQKKNLLTDLSLIFIAVIWALNFTVIKASLSEIDPYSFNAFRFIMAALFLWAIVYYRGETFRITKKDWVPLTFLGLAGNLLYQWLFIIGIDLTLAANAAIMLGTIPIWIALGSHFFSIEFLNRLKSIGVVLGFAGVILIITTGEEPISVGSDTFRGDVIIILAAIVLGVYTIFSKSFLTRYTPLQFSAFMTTLGAICLFLIAIPHFHRTDWSEVSVPAYGGMVYSGTLAIGLAYVIWNNGIHRAGAVRTATYQNLVPVLGLLFGIILLGESLAFWQYIGSAVVVAGILFTKYGGRV